MNFTSLTPLDPFFPEKCAFIFGCSSTLWTKTRSLASSVADVELADKILILLCPQIQSNHNYKEGKASAKKVLKLVTQKTLTSMRQIIIIRKVRRLQKSTETSNTKTLTS